MHRVKKQSKRKPLALTCWRRGDSLFHGKATETRAGFQSQSEKRKTATQRSPFFWWRRVDSNHRSETQQIYSLPPLATRELLHMKLLELVDGLEPPTC